MIYILYTMLPILGIFFLWLTPKTLEAKFGVVKYVTVLWSLVCFFVSFYVFWSNWNYSNIEYLWNFSGLKIAPKIGFIFSTGIDGLSLFFLTLTWMITLLCILSIKKVAHKKYYITLIMLIQSFLNAAFCTTNLLIFYIAFESVLIPMFLIIGVWGSSTSRKIKASFFLFLYTFICSTFALFGIFDIFYEVGSLDFFAITNTDFCVKKQMFLWIVFFLAFAVKIPMFPIHIWLPEAHVQAPTEGSVILAALLLKLGGYGFIRISLPMFPYASVYFAPFVHTICILSIIYASFTTIIQNDLKKIIAYSSIAHMNLVVLGIFSFNHFGLQGALFLMIGHGIVSSGLFFMVGFLYDRHHTRMIPYFGGLVQVMPIYSVFFFIFILANMSMPGTSNFVGEFLIFNGIFCYRSSITIIAALSVILCAVYSIWTYNRIIFGNLNLAYINGFEDLTFIEFSILSLLMVFTIFLGIYPDVLLNYSCASIEGILQNMLIKLKNV